MIALIYAPTDSALGLRIRGDLEANSVAVADEVQPGNDSISVVVLSTQSITDNTTQEALVKALENGQHVIPVFADSSDLKLPRIIDNLQPIDYSSQYDIAPLIERINALSAPDAPPPLTTLTPSVRAANRQTAILLSVAAVVVFVLAIIGVATGTTVPPQDEFASVDTQVYLTRSYFIDEALPLSTEQAAEFAATIEEVPTRARVQLIQTATAISAGVQNNFVPRSTEDATNFATTLRAVSTIVRDDLADLATQAASEGE